MAAGFQLEGSKIAIVGLGLMGGSLALALKGKCAGVYGVETDPATLERALDQAVVDAAEASPVRILPEADLVILATPVPTIIRLIQLLPSFIAHPCVILDLGSTKSRIVAAMQTLPAYFDVLGGHPLCGKETLGLNNADGHLYQNAPFIITPLERTTRRARSAAEQLIAAIGAHMIELSSEDHDRALAFTSHLPFLISSALVSSTPSEYSPLIGTGFRSTSRLAGTPSSMMLGILQSNRQNVMNALSEFQDQIAQIQSSLMSEESATLEKILDQSQSAYAALIL